jgi:hypothetical protein
MAKRVRLDFPVAKAAPKAWSALGGIQCPDALKEIKCVLTPLARHLAKRWTWSDPKVLRDKMSKSTKVGSLASTRFNSSSQDRAEPPFPQADMMTKKLIDCGQIQYDSYCALQLAKIWDIIV